MIALVPLGKPQTKLQGHSQILVWNGPDVCQGLLLPRHGEQNPVRTPGGLGAGAPDQEFQNLLIWAECPPACTDDLASREQIFPDSPGETLSQSLSSSPKSRGRFSRGPLSIDRAADAAPGEAGGSVVTAGARSLFTCPLGVIVKSLGALLCGPCFVDGEMEAQRN